MIRILTLFVSLLFIGWSCGPKPQPVPPIPVASGGSVSIGGSPATGGIVAAAGMPSPWTEAGSPPIAGDWPTCDPPTKKARPVVRHKLGRHRGAITKRTRAGYTVLPLPDAAWPPLLDSLNQRDVGACTGFATLQCRLTTRWLWPGTSDLEALDLIALGIYSGATKRDSFAGSWPPNDTGSTGEFALDEAVAQGYFSGYVAVTSFEELQSALQHQPCITGTDWPEGFFAPDRCGAVKRTGAIAGGHEWVIEGIRYETKQILGRTSWGDFGAKWNEKSGFFWVTFGDFNALFDAGGDIHCPRTSETEMTYGP
jgi:hypothetical protein